MTKEVLISISGLHMGMDSMNRQGEESIEVLSAANYYYKNGKHYILFEEVEEELHAITKTQIKWQGSECLEIAKRGIANTHMILEKNKRNVCHYHTPFGHFELGLHLTDMSVEESEENIYISAKYTIDLEEEPLSDCNISIRIRPRDAKDFSIIS